jgi:murein DD-endopeptidase MepM/ murein hydrolase activator NlpD
VISKEEEGGFFSRFLSSFLPFDNGKEPVYIRVHPPELDRGVYSFSIMKKHVFIICISLFVTFFSALFYLSGSFLIRYYYIRKEYKVFTTVKKKRDENKKKLVSLREEFEELRLRAEELYLFSERVVNAQDLRPLVREVAAKGVVEERDLAPLRSFVEGLADRYSRLSLLENREVANYFYTPLGSPLFGSYYISSRYGWRHSPFTKLPSFHRGMDLAADQGTPIRATAYGVVVFAGSYPKEEDPSWARFGRTVMIRHGDTGLYTLYAHCQRVLVKGGDVVRRGQIIAEVGSTGRSTAPHLHYEVRQLEKPINPYPFLRGRGEMKLAKKLLKE